jgi:phosphatidylserine decarboxylase
MVRDGYYYALGCIFAAVLLGWLTWPILSVIPLLFAAFFLWFFRDPERVIPDTPGAVISCADGKVTDISTIQLDGQSRARISIFLNVFNVHVNRSPISGVITSLEYKRGKFQNAMGAASAEMNEQNICTLRRDDGQVVIFKQIAGLLARRIVFDYKIGDRVERGHRVGLIKFGSRCDVILPSSGQIAVKVGDLVKGGSSILATLPVAAQNTGSPQTVATEKGR